MVTLMEFYDIARLPIKDAKTGRSIKGQEILASPDAIVKSVSFDVKNIEFVVEVGAEE